MATKKITLNELRSLVKQIIKEETGEKTINELFGFGGGSLKPNTRVKDNKTNFEWLIDKFVKKTDAGDIYIVRDPSGSGKTQQMYTNQFSVIK